MKPEAEETFLYWKPDKLLFYLSSSWASSLILPQHIQITASGGAA